MTTSVHTDADLIKAVYDDNVSVHVGPGVARRDTPELAATLAVIRHVTEAEASRLRSLVAPIEFDIVVDPSSQRNLLTAELDSWSDAQQFVNTLTDTGYVRWQSFDAGADEVFFRTGSRTNLTLLDDTTFVVDVRWPPHSGLARVPRLLVPTGADLRVALPMPMLWPLYFAMRPVRLALNAALRRERTVDLGPILKTPASLVPGLLKFADVHSDDHLLDLGCGDGGVLVAAAKSVGCRVTGVESSPALAELARERINAELGNHPAEVIEGDASNADLADVTAVFLFVPSEVAGAVAADLRGNGFIGRIVSHEQSRPQGLVQPRKSALVRSADALTVAHCW